MSEYRSTHSQNNRFARLEPYAGLIVYALLSYFVIAQFYIGGVALDGSATETGYELLMRDPEQHWQQVSVFRYWFWLSKQYIHSTLIVGGLLTAIILFFRGGCKC